MSPRRFLGLCTLVLVTAGCGVAQPEAVRVERPSVTVAPTPTPVPTVQHPLTGATFPEPADWQSRPALAVKIENSSLARPQSGLDRADVVYEELAEGGITRFIAVFQSREATKVGPVRSARRVDPDVLAAVGGLFAYAGAVDPVVRAVRATPDITDVGVNREPDAYYRASDRKAPHNLYTSTPALWSGRRGPPPAQLFTFGAPAGGGEGTAIGFSFSGLSDQTRYVYQDGAYRRFHGSAPHLLDDGTQVAPANVIVQVVSVSDSEIVDTNGQRSPESRVTGEGEAILLSAGRMFRGKWIRGSLREPTRFVDASGAPFLLQPGSTWIELLPAGRPVSIG